MTQPTQNTQMLAQTPTLTVRYLTPEDVALLCEFWIRDRDLFLRCSHDLSPGCFFGYSQFAVIFEALCLANHQFRGWDCAVLTRLIEETAPNYPIFGTRISLEELTRQGRGGFVFDTLAKGQLNALERENARQLQERFLREKTVFGPLMHFLNPGHYPPNERPDSLREIVEAILAQDRRISSQPSSLIESLGQQWNSHELQLEIFRGCRMIGLETGFTPID